MSRKKMVSKKITLLSGFALLAFCSAPAQALSDQEIEQRFKKIETENQKLRQALHKSEQKDKKQFANLKRMAESQDRLQIHGFMSVAASKANDDVGDTAFNFREALTYRSDTVFAIQFDYQLGEQTKLVSQLMANGRKDFDVEAEWIYLSQKLTDNWTVRAGRMRLPIYYYSDSIEVGFAYPWARPPIEIYASTQPNFEGVDTLYRFNYQDWFFTGQLFSGVTAIEGNPYDYLPPGVGTVKLINDEYKGSDYFGGNIVASQGAFSYRLGYFHFDVSGRLDFTNSNFPNLGVETFAQRSEYLSAAVLFNDDVWFALLEIGKLNPREAIPLGDDVGGIGTLGRRFGKWTPHLSYSTVYTVNDPAPTDPPPQRVVFRQNSTTLGVRYDLLSNTCLKLEISRYTGIEGHGLFGSDSDIEGAVSIYTATIDSTF